MPRLAPPLPLGFLPLTAWAQDSDGDGVDDVHDSCPLVANATQTDTDGDGVGDGCDPCQGFDDNGPDSDGDGTVDADSDGVPEDCDLCAGDDSLGAPTETACAALRRSTSSLRSTPAPARVPKRAAGARRRVPACAPRGR